MYIVTYQAWNGVTKTQKVGGCDTAERAKEVFSQLSGVTGRAIFSVEEENLRLR